MKIIGLIIAISVLPFITACQTTGNPNEGGLFGWSETKAQDRLHSRESTLSSVERDTARHSSAASRRRQMLGE